MTENTDSNARRADRVPEESPIDYSAADGRVQDGRIADGSRVDAAPSASTASTASQDRTTARSEPTTTVEPTRITLDPSLDAHQRQGVTGGTWIALILGTVILVLLLIFILQNNVAADFAYFGFDFSLPLGVAMLFAAIAGVLITALLGSVRLFKLSRRVRKLEKERLQIKQALR